MQWSATGTGRTADLRHRELPRNLAAQATTSTPACGISRWAKSTSIAISVRPTAIRTPLRRRALGRGIPRRRPRPAHRQRPRSPSRRDGPTHPTRVRALPRLLRQIADPSRQLPILHDVFTHPSRSSDGREPCSTPSTPPAMKRSSSRTGEFADLPVAARPRRLLVVAEGPVAGAPGVFSAPETETDPPGRRDGVVCRRGGWFRARGEADDRRRGARAGRCRREEEHRMARHN